MNIIFFFESSNNNFILSQYNNISCLNEIGKINQKQIFFIKQINETIETSIETTIYNKQTNQINNYATQTKIISTDSYINDLSSEEKKSEEILTSNIYTEKNLNIENTTIPKAIEQIKELTLPKANITKEEILENIELIMNNTVIGETYEYQEEDFSILIYPTDSSLLTNKTHIDFIECESVLKSHYNLSNESIITFFQMEISNKNERSLINQVEYQVYNEQKKPLDLSLCNDSNIKVFYGIKNNTGLDLSILDSFKDSGVNVFNISDEFFNDVCYPYSEDGNDLILEDRIKEVYQNYTLCEEGCSFDSIDITNMLISCQLT